MHDLDFFFPDTIAIEKAEGPPIPAIKAQFSGPGKVLLYGDQTIVAEGDVLVRKHDNGAVERYNVINVEYQKAVKGLPAVTNLLVEKQGSKFSPHAKAVQNIYNVSGPNARVNVQAQDSSVNIVNVAAGKLFADLAAAIDKDVEEVTLKNNLLASVSDMQSAQGGTGFTEKFQNFMALAANCITTVSPFLPALSQFLR
jgi:hypothetical protein